MSLAIIVIAVLVLAIGLLLATSRDGNRSTKREHALLILTPICTREISARQLEAAKDELRAAYERGWDINENFFPRDTALMFVSNGCGNFSLVERAHGITPFVHPEWQQHPPKQPELFLIESG